MKAGGRAVWADCEPCEGDEVPSCQSVPCRVKSRGQRRQAARASAASAKAEAGVKDGKDLYGGSRRGREETSFEVESHGILYVGDEGKAALVAMLR